MFLIFFLMVREGILIRPLEAHRGQSDASFRFAVPLSSNILICLSRDKRHSSRAPMLFTHPPVGIEHG